MIVTDPFFCDSIINIIAAVIGVVAVSVLISNAIWKSAKTRVEKDKKISTTYIVTLAILRFAAIGVLLIFESLSAALCVYTFAWVGVVYAFYSLGEEPNNRITFLLVMDTGIMVWLGTLYTVQILLS